MFALLAFVLTVDAGPPACRVGLCGDPMRGESACYCNHGDRCWDVAADCELDAACVAANPKKPRAFCADETKRRRKH